jgi:trimeric autotransporter adhesin
MLFKTLQKRIALVLVAALGFGLTSAATSSAAAITSLSNVTLSGSTSNDYSLVLLNSGSLGARYSEAQIFTQASTVTLGDLTATVTGVYAGSANTYDVTFSPDNISTGSALSNYATIATPATTNANPGTVSTRAFSALGATTGTYSLTSGSTKLSVGTHYLYFQTEAAAAYTAANDWKLKVTISNPTNTSLTATMPANSSVSGRVNNLVSVPVTVNAAAFVGSTGVRPFLRLAASITQQPADSSVQPILTAGSAAIGSNLTRFDATKSLSAGSSLAISASVARDSTADSTSPASLIYTTTATSGTSVDALTSADTEATLSFNPTYVGTYRVTVWVESSHTGIASLSGSESYQTFTIIVSAGVSTVTLTPFNATSVEDGVEGSLIEVSLKDAAGNAAALASGEALTLDATGTGLVKYKYAGAAGAQAAASSTPGAAFSLSASDFVAGKAWINLTNTVAETSTLVATLSSNSAVTASTAITFNPRSTTLTATVAPTAATTGWRGSSTTYTVPQVASVNFTLASGSSTTASFPVTIVDTNGAHTGKIGGKYSRSVAPGGTFTIAATFDGTTSSDDFTVGGAIDNAGANTADAEFQAAARNISTSRTDAVDTILVQNASLRVNPAGTASFTITVTDQFGVAIPNARATMSWTGRNASTAATAVVATTSATGVATFSYTDTAASTVTATVDTVTFTVSDGTQSDTSTATVNWVTTTVGTLVLTSTGDTDVVAGTTKTDISAAAAGATGTSATASALVKDAAGVVMVGVPVTFVVTGLVGAEVHTTKATVYTDSTGTAVSNISSYAAGKATVTATAGTVTATDDVYFSQQTLTEARTIAATVSGNNVVATVKDRYGNTIEGVTVNATRVGTGFFGTGASTATGVTDANGVIEFQYNGAGTITVAFSTTTYGQSSSAAAKVGTTAVTAAAAGTATANQTGLGASLAPAGVNSVAVTVAAQENAAETAATAAADAAAEATDAANAATDAANAAAEAADAATAAAQDAADAVAALSTSVSEMINALKKQITSLTNLVIKIQKKVRA